MLFKKKYKKKTFLRSDKQTTQTISSEPHKIRYEQPKLSGHIYFIIDR